MERPLDILIVEDSKIVMERLVSYLEEMPLQKKIEIAYTYDQATTFIKSKDFDILICDTNLADRSGMDLLRFIRDQKRSVGHIIMTTVSPSPEKEALCRSLGAHYFLNKFSEFENISHILTLVASGNI